MPPEGSVNPVQCSLTSASASSLQPYARSRGAVTSVAGGDTHKDSGGDSTPSPKAQQQLLKPSGTISRPTGFVTNGETIGPTWACRKAETVSACSRLTTGPRGPSRLSIRSSSVVVPTSQPSVWYSFWPMNGSSTIRRGRYRAGSIRRPFKWRQTHIVCGAAQMQSNPPNEAMDAEPGQ
ncbi:hypothetical protein C8R43DRAFT_353886 [Mycena crocata]|nr:hypothetical protein C8R43DRAFT_353886 [Mycena crocata]